ncbi:FG-GAP-like repeat-containing protein [Streptomyces vietnamensis]|uniref:FG-GAP-like repeat-containing protein n=1 Tax=Streptomyces vietnamensis TaxID=362257 RepID=UPI000698B162|nr:FG-GAP-like repeat-containing protein [Streptomyces vietnamensis]
MTAVLAVTAGTLAAGPAALASASASTSVQGPADALDGAISIPQTSRIVGSGPSGFLTVENQHGREVYRWTSTVDRTTTTLDQQSEYLAGHSDTVVTRVPTRPQYLLRDMSDPSGATTVIEQPDTRQRLRTVIGRTLLFSSYDFTSKTGEVRLRSEGVYADSDRKVAGFPADAQVWRAETVSPTTALVRYTVDNGGSATGFLAVVDVTTAQVVEKREAGARDFAASATSFAWVGGEGGVGGETTDPYAARILYAERGGEAPGPVTDLAELTSGSWNFNSMHIGLVGSWVTYGLTQGGTTQYPTPYDALTAVDSHNPDNKIKLLDHATSSVSAPDGSLLVRGGSVAHGEGIYRIAPDPATGRPAATLVASTGQPTALTLLGTDVPATVDFDALTEPAKLSWTLSRNTVEGSVTLRHKATGRKAVFPFNAYVNAPVNGVLAIGWDGMTAENLGDLGDYAPAGEYTWELSARPLNNIGPNLKQTGTFKVARKTGPHDYTSNTSPDLLARDASGKLWRDDTVVTPAGEVSSTGRYAIGTGWGIYNQLEAVGNVAGGAAPDLLARDASGVLWLYQGNGNGGFATRVKVGSGWNTYKQLTGGSDLNGDGRSDLLATDTTGALWFYKGTGSTTAPFAARVKVGGGWGIYNQITATGNLAGTAAGDLVARDTSGVLWLYQGNGSGGFTTRVKVGSGWGGFTHLVGVGDADRDGRADLYAAGPSGFRLYSGTGVATAPFKPGVFTDVHSGAAQFNSIF